MTHDSWSYSTQPTSHQFCGTISYSATYEGVVADEYSMPNMVYHQTNQTFGIYSTDFGLLGTTTLTMSGYLTDYPMITTVDGEAPQTNINQSVQIEITDPCPDPISLSATDQGDPLEYRYTGSTIRLEKSLIPFEVTPLVCQFTYECSMISGPRLDLCDITDGTSVGSFDPDSGDYFF